MKVNGDKTAIQLDAYLKKIQANKAQAYESQKKPSGTVHTDPVELSGKARAMQQAANEMNQAENGIAQRVKQVKLEIDKGTYKLDAAKVAKDMLNESFENNQVLNRINVHA